MELLDKISDIIKKHLTYGVMEERKEDWETIVYNNEVVLVDYAYYFVSYQNLYFKEVYNQYYNLSMVIYDGKHPIAIWPLCVFLENNKWKIGSNGGQVLEPILKEGYGNKKFNRKILKKCFMVLQDICSELGISSWKTRCTVMTAGIGLWEKFLLENSGRSDEVVFDAFVDLTLDEDDILAKMYKKNLEHIKKSRELWQTKIITRNDGYQKVHDIFKQFRAMHIEVAGRETRGLTTWEKQEEALLNSDDFLVALYDDDRLVGVSLMQTSKSVGVYSVGVYDRNLFDKPVAHISHWLAIQHMKELGLKWYYVGHRVYPNDWNMPTSKEVNIGHFKEGFSTNVFPKIILCVDVAAKEI